MASAHNLRTQEDEAGSSRIEIQGNSKDIVMTLSNRDENFLGPLNLYLFIYSKFLKQVA